MRSGQRRRWAFAVLVLGWAAACRPAGDGEMRELDPMPPDTNELEVWELDPGFGEGRHDVAVVRAIARAGVGSFLVDERDRPFYLFAADSLGASTCYDACAEVWPPLLEMDGMRAELPVDEELLGTVERADGRTQVTYGGWPLYFYTPDGAHSTTGHGVVDFGATWYLMGPDGQPLAAP